MADVTFWQTIGSPLTYVGLGIFSVSPFSQMYMQMKTGKMFLGWSAKYKEMVREQGCSPWPLRLYYVCGPIGIVLCFTGVLLMPLAP